MSLNLTRQWKWDRPRPRATPRTTGRPVKLGLVDGAEPKRPEGSGRSLGRLVLLLQRKPPTARRATVIMSVYTVLVTLAGGTLVWLLARDDFASFGAALWWAVQTVTTVGYGDVVPSNTEGRVIGVIVMLSGIGFLTVITAAVTASLIEAARRRLERGSEHDLAAQLAEIKAKLSVIESRVTEHDSEAPAPSARSARRPPPTGQSQPK